MSPLSVCFVLLSVHEAVLGSSIIGKQVFNLEVEYDGIAILPCNGSALLEEEGGVVWETSLGEAVVTRTNEQEFVGDSYRRRVQLLPGDHSLTGNWSLVINHATLRDSGTYHCIWEGQRQRVLSTVWLSVKDPAIDQSLQVFEGDSVTLRCYLRISSLQSSASLKAWWTLNGSMIVSRENMDDLSNAVFHEDEDRLSVWQTIPEELFLEIYPAVTSDNGEYRCWYHLGDSEISRPGFPDRIQLTVMEMSTTVPVTDPVTDPWIDLSTSPRTEEATETTESDTKTSTDPLPVLLEESTEPMKGDPTESQPMEVFEETFTIFPDQGTPSDSLQSADWDSLPWVRIGLISGVLLLTAIVLCSLKAQQRI